MKIYLLHDHRIILNNNHLYFFCFCFVLNIETTTYDSFIHERVPKKKNRVFSYIGEALFGYSNLEFEHPIRKSDLNSTLMIYLEGIINDLKSQVILSLEDVSDIYRTLHNIIKYSEAAKVVNVSKNTNNGVLFYQEKLSASMMVCKLQYN